MMHCSSGSVSISPVKLSFRLKCFCCEKPSKEFWEESKPGSPTDVCVVGGSSQLVQHPAAALRPGSGAGPGRPHRGLPSRPGGPAHLGHQRRLPAPRQNLPGQHRPAFPGRPGELGERSLRNEQRRRREEENSWGAKEFRLCLFLIDVCKVQPSSRLTEELSVLGFPAVLNLNLKWKCLKEYGGPEGAKHIKKPFQMS